MENRTCPVCGGIHSDFINRIDMKVPKAYHLPQHYSIVSCQSCGMVYADTAASMEDYDYYYTHCNFYGDDSKDDNSFRYEMMEEILGCFCQKDTAMLEIGAGNGRFEIALKEHGYTNITGTDPSSESVERLRAAGIRAHISNIYSPVSQMEKGKYGCVFLFEVAEHLLVPGKAIGNVKEMLKEDGIFMVSVPDYSLIAKETKYGIPAYFNLEHINYFSETSLDSLMDAYGMERVYQKRVGGDLIHCYRNSGENKGVGKDTATQKAVRDFLAACQEKNQRTAQIISGLKEAGREVAVWGTGAYSMNLAAETDLLGCRIQGFIDNNKLKQGREMYGYPVYPPEFLEGKEYMVLICSMLDGPEIQEQLESMGTKNDSIIL